MDCGVVGRLLFRAEHSNGDVARAGGSSIYELIERGNLSHSLETMGRGAACIVERLYRDAKINGAISVGSGQGTYLGMRAMEPLLVGFPKVMVSTLARAVRELFVNARDTTVIDPIVDIAGLNGILAYSLGSAATIICSMVNSEASITSSGRKVIAVTMFGVTTRCVDRVRERLRAECFEVWIFHSNGVGGMNIEKLIRCGLIHGVIDLTTAEVSQTVLGGTAGTSPARMEAAGKTGIPQIVSVGGMDMVNFLETVPERNRSDAHRRYHMNNPSTTIMRSESRDYDVVGRVFAQKLNRAKGSVQVLLPLRGLSEYDKPGGIWHDAEADRYLYDRIEENLRCDISIMELGCHINDASFADAAAQMMSAAMRRPSQRRERPVSVIGMDEMPKK